MLVDERKRSNILPQNKRQEEKPLPPKRQIGVRRGKMSMDVTPKGENVVVGMQKSKGFAFSVRYLYEPYPFQD